MLTISPKIYEHFAESLIKEIGSHNFCSANCTLQTPEVDYRLEATLLIRHILESLPEGDVLVIEEITPVWWEFHTSTDEGEQLNDFDFNILRSMICL